MRPKLESFNPADIKWHDNAMDHYENVVRERAKTKGLQVVLFSGSVGSVKSLIMEHMMIRYLVENEGAKGCCGRLAMPDCKTTIFRNLVEHTPEEIISRQVESPHGIMELNNGSELWTKSWSDWNMEKLGSHEYHIFAIEELTESDKGDAYQIINMRTRLGWDYKNDPTAKDKDGNILLIATNPNGTTHWAYSDLILKAGYVDGKRIEGSNVDHNIHLFYSKTLDNPFNDKPGTPHGTYRKNLLKKITNQKMADRMLDGKWVDISGKNVYYNYDDQINFINKPYNINKNYPIRISFDFNVGDGKPASACAGQYIPNGKGGSSLHTFKEWILDGCNTYDMMDEIVADGILDHKGMHYIIHGDQTGYGGRSSAKFNDFEIIEDALVHYKERLSYEVIVPSSNPGVKVRHNLVNLFCKNMDKECNLFVYEDCPTVNKGMMGTVLKKGTKYQEDDGPLYPFQHVTTALGYMLYACTFDDEEIEYIDW